MHLLEIPIQEKKFSDVLFLTSFHIVHAKFEWILFMLNKQFSLFHSRIWSRYWLTCKLFPTTACQFGLVGIIFQSLFSFFFFFVSFCLFFGMSVLSRRKNLRCWAKIWREDQPRFLPATKKLNYQKMEIAQFWAQKLQFKVTSGPELMKKEEVHPTNFSFQ